MSLESRLVPARLEAVVRPLLPGDPAHDWSHVCRVFRSGVAIGRTEASADPVVLRAALLLHDIGEKRAGIGTAKVTREQVAPLLLPLGIQTRRLDLILAAINEHSFSRGARPTSIEAAVVQDADRLDAIGAIGIARCFAYGGALGRPLYDPDDERSSLAHFDQKLLHLAAGMHTKEGARLATVRHATLVAFRAQFLREWGGDC